jgi:hypothetical protein
MADHFAGCGRERLGKEKGCAGQDDNEAQSSHEEQGLAGAAKDIPHGPYVNRFDETDTVHEKSKLSAVRGQWKIGIME